MLTKPLLSRSIGLKSVTLCGLLACALVASADVKTTSKMTFTMSMGGQPPKSQSMTSYYRKGVMRVDGSDGTTFIMDSKNKKSITINKNAKTYSEMNMDGVAPAEASQYLKDAKVKLSGHVKPTRDKKMIAGKSAMKYLLDMTIDMTMPGMNGQPSMGTMHGDVTGAFWTTTAIKDKISGDQMMGAYTEMLKGLSAFGDVKQLKKEFAKFKGLPLNSQMNMTMTMKPAKGAGAPPTGTPMTFTMTMENEVQTIKEGPLDASLFVVPKGYKKTKANFGRSRMGS